MATYSNDPARPAAYPPAAPAAYPPPAYPPGRLPGGPVQPDNRPLLIAALVALVALVAVVGYYLLVYVPGRDARLAETAPASPTVATERPPGSLADDGDGFRPSVIEQAPPVRPNDRGARATDDEAEREADGVDGADGLEAPPRRAPLPAPTPEPRPETRPAPAPAARAEHEAFARDYLARQTDDAASNALGLYATTVRYYSLGLVDAQRVYDDKDAYYRRFPDRRYALAGPVRVLSSTGAGAATLRFDYTFAVGGGPGGERSGRANVELDIIPSGNTFLIRGEQGNAY